MSSLWVKRVVIVGGLVALFVWRDEATNFLVAALQDEKVFFVTCLALVWVVIIGVGLMIRKFMLHAAAHERAEYNHLVRKYEKQMEDK